MPKNVRQSKADKAKSQTVQSKTESKTQTQSKAAKPKRKPIKTLSDALIHINIAGSNVRSVHEFEDKFVIDLKTGERLVVKKG